MLAAALISITAIMGLTAAMIWDIPFIYTIAAIISSIVIIKWYGSATLPEYLKIQPKLGKFSF